MKHAVRLIPVVLALGLLVVTAGLLIRSNSAQGYIGNRRSHVFHRQSCYYLPFYRNRTHFDTRAEALKAGYRPCQKCRP